MLAKTKGLDTSTEYLDLSVLSEQAKWELLDFYQFLLERYGRQRRSKGLLPPRRLIYIGGIMSETLTWHDENTHLFSKKGCRSKLRFDPPKETFGVHFQRRKVPGLHPGH